MNNTGNEQYDVVIVGGGMVGSMLCAALATASLSNSSHASNQKNKQPLRVCLLEDKLPPNFEPGSKPEYDLRVSALSKASQNMLTNVGAWDGIVARRCCEYKRLSVWDSQQDGRTNFNAADIRASHLGHIVENRVIQLALLERIAMLGNVSLLSPARLGSYRYTQSGVELILEDDSTLHTQLLVGADGANSVVRQQAGIVMNKKNYPQHALVANIETELAQQDITWQRFVPAGPQAFLPLCGQRGSIVWYDTGDEIDRLKVLDDEAFIDHLQQSFPTELGRVNKVFGRASFPIAKAHANTYLANRIALVGDAAHTVHPLAGQGVNIGLLDAAALAQVLVNAHIKDRDLGDQIILRRYQRWRYTENQIMISALDAIYEAFKPRPLIVQKARSASLNMVEQNNPIKQLVMKHAMGLSSDIPLIAQN